jgi:hypothetical protein
MSRAAVTLSWVLTRGLTLVLLFSHEGTRGVAGDLTYFAHSLASVPDLGLSRTLVEYPLPAVGVLAVPWGLAALLGSTGFFPLLLVVCALVTDGAFTALLASRGGPGRTPALLLWLLAAPLLGSITLARFDLLAGILVACGVLVAERRPRAAAAAFALAAGVKLWPVILLPSLMAATRRRSQALLAFVVVGAVLAVASLLLAGPARLFSPLTYQADRGLQVESLAAAPALVGWLVDPGAWRVDYTRFRAFEVAGPGVPALLLLSTLLSIAFVAGLVLLWWRALRLPSPVTSAGLLWLTLASVCGFLVSAKVFSPQYLLWLLPVTAAGLVVAPTPAVRRWAAGLLVVAALTHLLYPLLYRGLVVHSGESAVAVPLLVVRDLLVVGLLVVAVRHAWRETSAGAGLEPGPRRPAGRDGVTAG